MAIDDKIRDEKLQYETAKEIKLINMNILEMKKYYL